MAFLDLSVWAEEVEGWNCTVTLLRWHFEEAFYTLYASRGRRVATGLACRMARLASDTCVDGRWRTAGFAFFAGLNQQTRATLGALELSRTRADLAAAVALQALVFAVHVKEASEAHLYTQSVEPQSPYVRQTRRAAEPTGSFAVHAFRITAEALVDSIVVVLSRKTVSLAETPFVESEPRIAGETIGGCRPNTGFAVIVATQTVVAAQILPLRTNDFGAGAGHHCEALATRLTAVGCTCVASEASRVAVGAAAVVHVLIWRAVRRLTGARKA